MSSSWSVGESRGLAVVVGRPTREVMFVRTVLAVRGEVRGCEGVWGGGWGCGGTGSLGGGCVGGGV